MDGHDAFGISKSYVPGQGFRKITELSSFERRGLKMSLEAKKAKAAKTNQAIPGLDHNTAKTSTRDFHIRNARKGIRRAQYKKGGQP